MILKKPYAFLIKYFKLIHIVLLLLMSYLLYRTNIVFNFFQEYINSNQLITGKDFAGQLFNSWMFIFPIIIVIVFSILLAVMYYKKKPIAFYFFNVIVMVAIFIIYNIGNNNAIILSKQLLETKTLRFLRDIFVILTLFQGLGVILTFIRATGFDIKKFDFGHDLEELDITAADSEEFEVDVNIETNILKRELKRKFRFAKYVYLENKFLINIAVLILFSATCFIIYINMTIYNKFYKQREVFSASEFAMSVSNSYITNKNYNNNIITDNLLVVVELSIKASLSDELKFNTTKAQLKVGKYTYYPNNEYDSGLSDLGISYNNSTISKDGFEKILLVYEIPRSSAKEKKIFSYIDNIESKHNKLNTKYIRVKINPHNLDSEEEINQVDLKKTTELNKNILGGTSIYLDSFEIKDNYKISYKYCEKDKCYDSIEYLRPTLDTNYDKALLKIEGNSSIDPDLKNKNINDLYSIIYYFGQIKYEIDGQVKYYRNLKKVNPTRTNINNTYYIEVPKEIEKADSISLIIDVRNISYEYNVK